MKKLLALLLFDIGSAFLYLDMLFRGMPPRTRKTLWRTQRHERQALKNAFDQANDRNK